MTTKAQKKWAERMRDDWDYRASRDSKHWTVNCVPEGEWNTNEYLYTGEQTLSITLDPFVRERGFEPEKKRAFEIGCGAGRITCGLAKRFAEVIGMDVSGKMVADARRLVDSQGYDNVTLFQGNGLNFKPQRARSIDFVYSAIVFQHIPDVDLQLGYLQETARILKKNGLFCISLYSDKQDYDRRLAWWKAARERGTSEKELVQVTLDNYETSMQTYLPPEPVDKTLAESGLEMIKESGRNTHTWWIYGRKIG